MTEFIRRRGCAVGIATVAAGMLALLVVMVTPPVLVQAQANPRSTPKTAGALTNTAVTINGSAVVLDSIHCLNPNTTIAYLQIYNVASATAVTVGTTVPTQSFGINGPAAGGANLEVDAPYNAYYSLGIKVAATTTRAGGVALTTPIDCNFTIR